MQRAYRRQYLHRKSKESSHKKLNEVNNPKNVI